MRPVRPLVPVAMTLFVLVGWAIVAHNGGSGWVQFLGEAVGAALLVGLLGPALSLARTRVDVVWAPPDAVAGAPIELRVRAGRRVRLRAEEPAGPDAFVGPARLPGAPERWTVSRPRHGLLETVVVHVQSAAPFGLLWWSKRVELPLPVTVHVAPRAGAPVAAASVPDDGTGEGRARTPAVVGEPRGARPYRPGDSRRWVHWPATAHSGSLMVRDMEAPVRAPVTVTVQLPPDPDAAERVVEQAMGTVAALVGRGVAVTLVTDEAGGPVVGGVDDRRRAGRRLARAVSATGAAGLPGVRVEQARLP